MREEKKKCDINLNMKIQMQHECILSYIVHFFFIKEFSADLKLW